MKWVQQVFFDDDSPGIPGNIGIFSWVTFQQGALAGRPRGFPDRDQPRLFAILTGLPGPDLMRDGKDG